MVIPRGSTDSLPVFDLDVGAGHDEHPALGMLFGASGGPEIVTVEKGLPSIPTKQDGFIATDAGRRFYFTNTPIDTPTIAQTGFDATTPTYFIRNFGASTTKGAFRSISIVETVTTAGGVVRVIGVLDTADRIDSGGVVMPAQNVNSESVAPSGVTGILQNATAIAAGAGTRPIFHTAFSQDAGNGVQIGFKDGLKLGIPSSLLIYIYATVAPSILVTGEYEDLP